MRLRPGRIRGQVPKVGPDQPAVVLFTSGSEKAPKAVPLTHENLLSNQARQLDRPGTDPQGFRAGLSAGVPQFRPDGDRVDAPVGRRAR